MHSLSRLAVYLTCAISTALASAEPISTMHSSVRALGMGDAYTALARDSSALYYNPAGLARVTGINLKIFQIRAGASGLEAYERIQEMQGSEGGEEYSDMIQELYGEHVWTGIGGDTAITVPMFGFTAYNHTDALIQIDNPVNPQIYTSIINDYGYTLGIGIPTSPFTALGVNLKYVKRSGARVPYGASVIADLDPDVLYNNITGWGKGYGADVGMNFQIPAPFFSATLSAVWRNVGDMKFRSDDPNADIPTEYQDMTVGASLLFDTPLLTVAPALDVRYLNREDIQLMRKINFGVEIGIPFLDIRGGFHEGYYTAGLGVNMGLFRVDAATYGVELGEYPGQIEDRRYVVEFTMELGVGSFGASGSGGGADGKGGKGGGKSKSIWGGSSRLKQRR